MNERKTPNLTWKENPGLAIPSPSFKPQSLSINNWNNILQAYWRPQEVSSALQDATGEHLHMSEWSAFPPASPVLQDNPGPCKHHQNFSRRCNDAHMYPPTVCVYVCVCVHVHVITDVCDLWHWQWSKVSRKEEKIKCWETGEGRDI